MNKKYLRALEFAAVGAAIPVVNGWINENPTDWHTAVKSLVGAVVTGGWCYVRANPPPDEPGPILPPPKVP